MVKVEALLFGLAIDCPFRETEENCKFKEIRKLPIIERIKYIKNIPFEKKVELYKEHRNCLVVRSCSCIFKT